jgi:hypothetical protein
MLPKYLKDSTFSSSFWSIVSFAGNTYKIKIRGVSEKFGEWYLNTNKSEDTNKLTLLALIWRLRVPDQGSTVDFFLFPRLKSTMKGTGFADVAAIQERVTAVLRSLPKEAFADSFQKLYERCQQCVVKDGDYFEGQ